MTLEDYYYIIAILMIRRKDIPEQADTINPILQRLKLEVEKLKQ